MSLYGHAFATCYDPVLRSLERARLHGRRAAEQAGRHQALGRDIEVVDAVAEALPLPTDSVDALLMTLVLCSVDDPQLAVAEARRVLRDDGVLVVIEHVRAETRLLAEVQRGLTPVWRRVARGCHLDRDPRATLAQGGFDVDALAAWQLSRRGPTLPAIVGHALPR